MIEIVKVIKSDFLKGALCKKLDADEEAYQFVVLDLLPFSDIMEIEEGMTLSMERESFVNWEEPLTLRGSKISEKDQQILWKGAESGEKIPFGKGHVISVDSSRIKVTPTGLRRALQTKERYEKENRRSHD